MNLVRCSNGHFYDADKSSQCPHCNGGGDSVGPTVGYTDYADTDVTTDAYSAGAGDYTSDVTTPGFGGFEDDSYTSPPTQGGLGSLFGGPDDGSYDLTKTVAAEDDSVTQSLSTVLDREPVVGWLVGLTGEIAGKSFELKTGKNFIGRGNNMDVVIPGDKSVSRNKHAIILFEPKNKLFMVQPGESRELFYLNGNVVLNTEKVQAYDEITIGNSELLFIPLCGEQFSWDERGNGE